MEGREGLSSCDAKSRSQRRLTDLNSLKIKQNKTFVLWMKNVTCLINKQRMLQSSSNKALHPSINVNHGGTLDEIRLPDIKSLVTATAVLPEDLT